ncbi:MAG: hypothetical protein V7717_08775 [Porticoccaceae bacterium]
MKTILAMRKYSFYLLLCFSLVLVYYSGRIMLSALWAKQLNTFLLDWEAKKVEPDAVAWQVAFDAASNAIALHPGPNADYYDRLGRVWEWKQFRRAFGDEAATESRQHAVDAYRQSVATRPMWPDTWVSLAYTKMRLREIDEEFVTALRRSAELGPWRIKSNKRVAEMGLITWFDLDEDTKELVVESIRRTVDFSHSQARWLESRAIDAGRRVFFCDLITAEIKTKRKICSA